MDTLVPIFRGVIGILGFTAIAYAFSSNRRAIDWKLVGTGTILQIFVALVVLKVGPVRTLFEIIGQGFVKVIDFTNAGTGLLFGWFLNIAPGNVDGLPFTNGGPVFVVTILPSIIFFAALTAMLYYLGVLQRVVYVFAWFMSKTMKLGGAESMSASANVFVGQTEAPLLIKPYLDKMTRSELLAIMVGGMATIAGGVMVIYISLLGGDDPAAQVQFATHLITKSVMSAPAALVIAKMLLPQTEEVNRDLQIPREKFGANILDAICVGTGDGIKLAINVGAMLIVFTALVAMINFGLGGLLGDYTGLNDVIASATGDQYTELSMQFVFGLIGAPIAWLMGIESGQLMMAGQLLGEKTVLNEFVAYFSMNNLYAAGELTDPRTRIILAYALAGFSNLVSIGIQIGGIGALAPERRADLAQLGWRALLGGSLACFIPASIAGMLI
ncbi:NupC/NupG family nucleoside CNT transporter [Synoicihabitans lomoniglobus]|uniref:Nucleoside transporter C-terminal domain-containing protein n=1 Tax=Synoicihabitans lomoniglobus TaxID=2909285 RepID=A0AAF0CMG4_9BACT|nr:Na+ dependent nucleoside transporter [Opitutaceae bacterium LMO-M01]WED63246.1 nucleoside transporter C-terminal domain-containing protein [Opitutaceae bacterium LMO-M01]